MLNTFRSLSGGMASKILLALLILSFAVWGIGDLVQTGTRHASVAKVGSHAISTAQYQRALKRETDNLRHMLGSNYSPELLRNLGVPQHVLQTLIQQELLRLESAALGLIPSDADVVRQIRGNPSFQDARGEFDKGVFEAMLRASGMTEKSYIEQLRQDIAVGLLGETLSGVTPVPETAVRTLWAAREEKRTADLYRFDALKQGEIPRPDEAQIKEYYEAHRDEFRSPEFRTISYVSFRHDDVAESATVSEDELRAAYKERQDEFRIPEQRVVDQLLYASEDAARKAYDMLKAGTDLKKVAAETNILNRDAISLGAVARGHIVEAAEEEVFALPAGSITQPVQSAFGWHVFRVRAIEAESVEPFEKVRAALEKDMKQQARDEAVNRFANTLEDALAAGATLKEVAGTHKLKVHTIGPITREGLTPEGEEAKNIPTFDNFLEVAFKTSEKAESPLAHAKGGVYYIVRVDKLTPERMRTLEEVKNTVIAGWQKDERAKHLAGLSEEVAKVMADPSQRSAAVEKYGLEEVASAEIRRSTQTAGDLALPPSLVADIFAHAPGRSTGAYPLQEGGYAIAVVKAITPAPPPARNSAELAEIRKQLKSDWRNELFNQYLNYLARKYSVTVNEDTLNAVVAMQDPRS